jgi:hypothetical protein
MHPGDSIILLSKALPTATKVLSVLCYVTDGAEASLESEKRVSS